MRLCGRVARSGGLEVGEMVQADGEQVGVGIGQDVSSVGPDVFGRLYFNPDEKRELRKSSPRMAVYPMLLCT
jgi:hypothetical protein